MASFLPEGFASNFLGTLKEYNTTDWLRLIAIVGGYILVRHQYMTWRTRKYQQQQQDEDERLRSEAQEEAKKVELEKLVGQTTSAGSGTDWAWGSSAKDKFAKRRKYIQNQVRRKAEMLENEDSDDDIKEYLQQ